MDEILDLIEPVSEGLPTYLYKYTYPLFGIVQPNTQFSYRRNVSSYNISRELSVADCKHRGLAH